MAYLDLRVELHLPLSSTRRETWRLELHYYTQRFAAMVAMQVMFGRTQYRELPLCAESRKGCQWQALPSPVQYEETATLTRDLQVIDGKTLPLAPHPYKVMFVPDF